MIDDINALIEEDPELKAALEELEDPTEWVEDIFNDPRVHKVLRKIVSTAVEAATYMR